MLPFWLPVFSPTCQFANDQFVISSLSGQSRNLFFELEPKAYLKLTSTLFHLKDLYFSLRFVVVASRFRLLLNLRSLCRAFCFAEINLFECLLLKNKKFTEFGV